MDFVVAFFAFILCMAISLIMDISMIIPLIVGLLMFFYVATRRGFSRKEVMKFASGSFKDSLIVVRILFLIGCLTGAWRISGTVAYFVALGIQAIPSSVFLLAAFLLASIMSYALGTSFGVTATAGVILISIARAGGINPILAAGAIYSGVYVGDRGSPAASSGNLVAVLTHTDMRQNVKLMLKTSWIAFAVCCILYAFLSVVTPMETMDVTILNELSSEFQMHWTCLIPAMIMIVLPFCGVKIPTAMITSLLSSLLVAVFVQNQSVLTCIKTIVLGFEPNNVELSSMLSGGGMASMLEVCVILMISGTYGGIFRGSDLLAGLTEKLKEISDKIGRFPLMLGMSFVIAAMFCNQTIGIIMQNQLSEGLYKETPEECTEKMLDIENSMVLTAGLVPWCIACSVPLAMLGADIRSLPFCFYLWLVPLFNLILKKKHDEVNL